MKRTMIAVLMVLGLSSEAMAQAPAWGNRQNYAADDTATPIHRFQTATSSLAACIGFGSKMALSADGGDALCVFSMTSTLTMTAPDAEAACYVTDGASIKTGMAPCVYVRDGAPPQKVTMPSYTYLARSPGPRTAGICSGYTDPRTQTVFPGCRVPGDCHELRAGTSCDTTISTADRVRMATRGCGFVVCTVDTDAADVILTVFE